MTLTDIRIKRLTEDVTLDLIIDALENIKPIKTHHEAHRIPILNCSNGNIVTPIDRTLRVYINQHRDLSQYTEITREQAQTDIHDCLISITAPIRNIQRNTKKHDIFSMLLNKYLIRRSMVLKLSICPSKNIIRISKYLTIF